jgi:hypothetical protein
MDRYRAARISILYKGSTLGFQSEAIEFYVFRLAIALDAQAVAVVLHFVEPIRAGWNLYSLGGQAELKRLKHAPHRSDALWLIAWNVPSEKRALFNRNHPTHASYAHARNPNAPKKAIDR